MNGLIDVTEEILSSLDNEREILRHLRSMGQEARKKLYINHFHQNKRSKKYLLFLKRLAKIAKNTKIFKTNKDLSKLAIIRGYDAYVPSLCSTQLPAKFTTQTSCRRADSCDTIFVETRTPLPDIHAINFLNSFKRKNPNSFIQLLWEPIDILKPCDVTTLEVYMCELIRDSVFGVNYYCLIHKWERNPEEALWFQKQN